MGKRKLFLDDLTPGQKAIVGYRNHRWESVFQGFVLEDGQPRAQFVDVATDAHGVVCWDAYLFNGTFCVGSSGDALVVHAILN